MPPEFTVAGEASTLKQIVFPINLSEGASAVMRFRTNVTVMDSGYEVRTGRWDQPLIRYNVVADARSREKINSLIAFLRVIHGSRDAFLFRDPWDYTTLDATADNTQDIPAVTPFDQNIGTANGSTTAFQLTKTYSIGGETQARNITRPESGTVRVGVNGAEVVNSGSPSDWHVDYTTGMLHFATPPSSGAVTWGGRFYVPMRLDTDEIEIGHVTYGVGSVSVPVVEVREA